VHDFTRCRAALLLSLLSCTVPLAAQESEATAVELDSRRLIGRAYYENDEFGLAIKELERCTGLAPNSAPDQFNLALVLLRASKYDECLRRLARAQELDPSLLAARYLRGIVFKRQNRYEEAVAELELVTRQDPDCIGGYYNLGMCRKYVHEYKAARKALETVLRGDPHHHGARYQLISLTRRLGDPDASKLHRQVFERIKDTVDESENTVEAHERSKYSHILQVPSSGSPSTADASSATTTPFEVASKQVGLRPAPAAADDERPPLGGKIRAADYSEEAARERWVPETGGAVTLGDVDRDGDLDIYVVRCSADERASRNVLYLNAGGGRFKDSTRRAGVGNTGLGIDAAFGDWDNDGLPDLYVANCGANALYRNRGDGTFEDVTRKTRVDEPHFGRTVAFFDYDHDGDLDLFIGNDVALDEPPGTEEFHLPDDFSGQANTLLRNGGDGTFADLTDEAGVLVDIARTRDVVYADFDGDHDTDLLAVNDDEPSVLFLNQRFGRFVPGGSFAPTLDGGATAIAEADFNRDGFADLLVAFADKRLVLYTNDGKAGFVGAAVELPKSLADAQIERIRVFDHDNDGWCDALLASRDSIALLASSGPGRFRDATAAAGLDAIDADVADLATGDLDGDGDEDVVLETRDRGTLLLRNTSGAARHWLDVQLVGKKVNRNGHAATVEIATGAHYQRRTAVSERVHFGLGDHDAIDIVRITWPNGVAQNVIRPTLDARLKVEERVKVSASCAFLFARTKRGFGLINEILGVGALGVPKTAEECWQPDSSELTKIEPDQLEAVDGRYELRLAQELREIVYGDRFELRVIDHPEKLEIVPNEWFGAPFPEDRTFAFGERRVPVAARDDRGADVLRLVERRDGEFPLFPTTEYDGVARPHSLTLDLGDLSGAERIVLCLDGWIYWPESSTVIALTQDSRHALTPLRLEVPDEQGRWHTAIEAVGLPTSKGLVVPVDLTGRFANDDYRVRLSTTLCTYFDRIFTATRDEVANCTSTTLSVSAADLHYRGFSSWTRDELGYERFDYDDVSPIGPWSPAEGLYTRYGDVTELVTATDDRLVIFGPGDELTMHFDASALPSLPAGWRRSFVFRADGWVKDGDLNTRLSQTVEPLPFHGMPAYPYGPEVSLPDTDEQRATRERYNTRPARATTGELPATPR